MVFEHRDTAGVVLRAPPLPIIASNHGHGNATRLANRRRNYGAGGSPRSTPKSASFTNGFTLTTSSLHADQQQKQQECRLKTAPLGAKSHSPASKWPQTPADLVSHISSTTTTTTTTTTTATTTTTTTTSGSSSSMPREPLDVDEYERLFRCSATDLELLERVFRTGLASNQLRSALWPYLFGLVKQRGRFIRRAPQASSAAEGRQREQAAPEFVYIEHEDNVRGWRKLERRYKLYETQWKSIEPEQELRFSSFRERKSLIERDVVRSDRAHPFYSASKNCANYAENLSNLNRLLMTYMMYDFDIGYLQGMSDLAAPILYVFQGDLVKSFWVFVEVMKLFRRNFEFSQKTIHFQLNCLFRLIKLTDAKLAAYLRDNDCSNCFFVFRHIVCQFKRELMRASSDSSPSQACTPADSSTSGPDDDDDEQLQCTQNNAGTKKADELRDDYANVLKLWDTIWFVQRRHELSASSKCVHTFKIAAAQQQQDRGCAPPQQQRQHCCNSATAHCSRAQQHNQCSSRNNNNSNSQLNNNSQAAYQQQSTVSSSTSHPFGCHTLAAAAAATRRATSLTSSAHSADPSSSISSSSSSSSSSSGGDDKQCYSTARHSRANTTNKVKQEQVVYTKQTFYSSFDPNQADVPRFELTETEKFVISLCLSLIRRERNYILQNKLDASEIHQHFIKPRLASDLNLLLGQAQEIYHYLKHDCDLQSLVKGASEFAKPSELSPVAPAAAVAAARRLTNVGTTPDELASLSAADSYDLLKDYFIISQSSSLAAPYFALASGVPERSA